MDGTPDKTTGYLVSDLVGMALRQIGVGAMGTKLPAVRTQQMASCISI